MYERDNPQLQKIIHRSQRLSNLKFNIHDRLYQDCINYNIIVLGKTIKFFNLFVKIVFFVT